MSHCGMCEASYELWPVWSELIVIMACVERVMNYYGLCGAS